jgi:hypothetical protein
MSSFLGGTRSGKAARSKCIQHKKKKKKTKEKVERKKRCGALAHTKNKKRLDIFIFQDRENELTKNKIKKEGCAGGKRSILRLLLYTYGGTRASPKRRKNKKN